MRESSVSERRFVFILTGQRKIVTHQNLPTVTFAGHGTFKWAIWEIWFEKVPASDVSHRPAVSLGRLA